jgi:DNA-binding IclR family transcriptional regulator
VVLEASDTAKTLDRGLRVLDLLAECGRPLTLTEIAEQLGLHRTIVHRLVRTLEAHGLVRRDEHLRYSPGIGLVRLAAVVRQDLRTVAHPVMIALADEIGATVNLGVADGQDLVVLATASPRLSNVHIAYRIGQRHPLTRGAAGLAILAARPPVDGERVEVPPARTLGYAVTRAEVVPGTYGISAAVWMNGEAAASIGVSLFDDASRSSGVVERIGERVRSAAVTISERLP